MRALTNGILVSLMFIAPAAMADPHNRGWVDHRGGVHVQAGPPGPRGNVVVGPHGGVHVRGGAPGPAGDVYVGPHGGARMGGPGYRVRVAPPAVRFEARPMAPSPRHTWAGGYWGWNGGRHVWNPGRWLAPRPGYVWIDPRWENQGGEWVFVDGSWQPGGGVMAPAPVVSVAAGGDYYADVAPPAPQVEIAPPPRPGFVWVPGYWNWAGGRHMWVGGHWEGARAGYVWEPHRWERHGARWRMAPGHWRR